MNLPIGAASMFMVITFLHVPHTPRKQKIDWWGAAAIILATVPLLLVAEQGREWGWDSPLAIAMYVAGVTGIISFQSSLRGKWESLLLSRCTSSKTRPLQDSGLGFIIGMGMFGGMIIIPLIIQVVYGVSQQ